MVTNLVIGAGISGLTFKYFSKDTTIVFEKESSIGGICKSIYSNGFVFDCSGHFLHIKDIKVKRFIENILKDNLLKISRQSYIYLKNNFIPYPFQANLFYLDDKTKKECIDGLKNRVNETISVDMPFMKWCNTMFGKGITKYFMKPYNKKLWDYDLNKLTAEWTAPFVPKPTIKTIIASAYNVNDKKYGYNSVFYYPKKGCGQIVDAIYKNVKNSIMLNSNVTSIDWKNKTLLVNSKRKYFYDNLIITQPLNDTLCSLINLPTKIQKIQKYLISTTVRCINIGIEYKNNIPNNIKNKHWIYFPEDKYPFYRVGIYSNVNKKNVPKKSYSLYVELSSMNNKFMQSKDIINILKDINIINKDDKIKIINIIDIPNAYVIFNKQRTKTLSTINKFLNDNNIYCLGRYGKWEYSFIEKNILEAQKLAKKIK